jgi:hypothetical protein
MADPPLMVYVAVQLMNGRTPIRVYTSGEAAGAAAASGAPAAAPAASIPVFLKTSRLLMYVMPLTNPPAVVPEL